MVRKPSFDCNGMKKGAWSEDEDNKLRAYIMRYGHWNWRLLPKYAGLARCGKSCRLRWENYLKPGIKRGNFSKNEQDLIVELHNKLGNKWSAIAAKLPGRSDNEIKNFWHTTEKRRKAINPTKEAHNTQILDQEIKPSQFTFCNTTQDESISFDCLIEFEDSKLSFDTAKSSETVEKTLVDFNNYDYIWRDIFLANDTAFYSQITCLPPLQEDDFKNYDYKELSSSESSYQSAMDWNLDNDHSIISSNYVAHDESVHGDFWSESFESYNSNSNSQSENSCISEDIEGIYDPCLEYFDYGMDLFS